MSAHNVLQQMNSAEFRKPSVTDAETLRVTRWGEIFFFVSAAAETRTLPAPTKAGQFVVLNLQTDGGDVVVTVTGGYDEVGSTTLTFTDAGQNCGLFSVLTASGTYRWSIIFNDGVAGPGGAASFSVLTFSGATGVPEIHVPSNLADALSIENAGGTLVAQVVTTTDAMALHMGDDVMLGVGGSNDMRFSWDTTDANANEGLLQMPAGTATNVPVLVIGQSIESVDLGLYNGVVDPRFCWIGVGAVATGPGLDFRKARGSAASPTVVTSGDDLFTLRGYACVAAGEWVQSTEIRFECTGTVATTRGPGVMTFFTATDAAPSVLTEAMKLDAAQLCTLAAGLTLTTGNATLLAGGDLIFSGTTGQSEITFTDNLADALSVKITGGADMMVFDSTDSNEKLTILSATTQKLGLWGTAPVVQPTALTAAKPAFTIADAEGTPDEAIQAVTQTTPFGFVNAAELITLLYKVQNLHVRVGEIESKGEAIGLWAAN